MLNQISLVFNCFVGYDSSMLLISSNCHLVIQSESFFPPLVKNYSELLIDSLVLSLFQVIFHYSGEYEYLYLCNESLVKTPLSSSQWWARLRPQNSRKALYEGTPWSRPRCIFNAAKSAPKPLRGDLNRWFVSCFPKKSKPGLDSFTRIVP